MKYMLPVNSEEKQMHIGWFLGQIDFNSASSRFRCFHIAASLSRAGIRSSFHLKFSTIAEHIATLDAIVVVKRIDYDVIKIAALGQDTGRPVFLDMCDDIMEVRYRNNENNFRRIVFKSILEMLTGIVVPSAAMAERMESYINEAVLTGPPVHVVPDIAETFEIYQETAEFLQANLPDDAIAGIAKASPAPAQTQSGQRLEKTTEPAMQTSGSGPRGIIGAVRRIFAVDHKSAPVPRADVESSARVHDDAVAFNIHETLKKSVVWFGNAGSNHNNSGIFSLFPYLKGLEKISKDVDFELVIISNNERLYKTLISGCGFSTRFARWSIDVVYDELSRADVALLTSGDDASSSLKSNGRVLQALAAGLPVFSSPHPSIAEFLDVVMTSGFEANLRKCLLKDPAERRSIVSDSATRQLLARYTPERVGELWEIILRRAVAKSGSQMRAREAPVGHILILVEHDSNIVSLQKALVEIEADNLQYELIVVAEAFQRRSDVRRFMSRRKGLLPRVVELPEKLGENALKGVSTMVADPLTAPAAMQLAELLHKTGGVCVTPNDIDTDIGLRSRSPLKSPHAAVAVVQPGPTPETLDTTGTLDWVFVTNPKARGWILDAICREIGSRQNGAWRVSYIPDELPAAKNYFFAHYSVFQKCLRTENEKIANKGTFVWYTHPRTEDPAKIQSQLDDFCRATKIIFTCSSNREIWLERGLPAEKAALVIGGADPDLFKGKTRGGGVVGMSSSFYERKNPDVLLDLVYSMPHRNFVLLGRNWRQYSRFEKLLVAPNFTYRTCDYKEYPAEYAKFDIFLSHSRIEGGPIPLLEAMMSNAVPVVSRTGFAPDLIEHGQNGFLFDVDASADMIAPLIEAAASLEGDVRETVVRYTWDEFSRSIAEMGEQ